jgi:2-haloalkanoic acid dehalogenase type II
VKPALLTFDCYGTLIDWHGGLTSAMAQVVKGADINHLARRYVEIEMEVEAGPYLPYRDVMAKAFARVLDEAGLPLADEDRDILGRTLPAWPPFPETRAVLQELARQAPLAILSNIDDDLLEGSVPQLGVPFARTITAQQVHSYKPHKNHFHRIMKETGLLPSQILHIGASLLHDMNPTRDLNIPHVWINRTNDPLPDWFPPTRSLPNLTPLPDLIACLSDE